MSKRYDRKACVEETPEQIRAGFPAELVNAFIKFVNAKFEEKEYVKFSAEAEKFLGAKYKDLIEQGKLVVRLTKATFELVGKSNAKKTKEAKKAEKLAGSKRKVSQSGADEGQEKGSEQEEM